MLETYKQFKRATEDKYVAKTNEELVEIYKGAKMEYERSQSIGALFVKNFPQIIKITSKYDYLESSEKAGRVALELVKSLEEYNGETKFITYLTTRINNLFLWDLGSNGKKIKFFNEMESISQHECLDKDGHFSSNQNEHYMQIEDKYETQRYKAVELRINIEKAFEDELNSYAGTSEYSKQKKRIEFNKTVLEILSEDPSLCASQIARKMGLFRKKEEYEERQSAPDVEIIVKKDENGNVVTDKFGRVMLEEKVTTLVRKANWNRVQKAIREIREMFINYNVCSEL